MDQPRCQGCGQFVDPEDEDVLDEKVPGGPRITDHKDCRRRLDEEEFSRIGEVEPPAGGWAKNSDMDRI